MRKAALALSLAILVPAAAAADEGPGTRFTVGLRAGYALAVGSAYADPATGHSYSLSDAIRSQVPVQVEAAYRLTERIAAGAYVSYGFDFIGRTVKSVCADAAMSCSASTIRVGVQGSFRPGSVGPGLSPWLGLGVGWEWSKYSQSGALEESFSGPEVVSLQAGADWRAGRRASVGPYVQVSVGRFGKLEQSAPAPFGSQEIDIDARFHAWIGFGLRGMIRL